MVLNNTLQRIVRLNRVVLVPGANTLDEAQVESLRAVSGQVEERVKNGTFQLMDMDLNEFMTGEEAGATDITEMNTREAVAVVRETTDVKTLRRFRETEEEAQDRKGVLTAIDKQLDKVEAATKKTDED